MLAVGPLYFVSVINALSELFFFVKIGLSFQLFVIRDSPVLHAGESDFGIERDT